MYVHVDPTIFEKRPLLGVALGAVAFCFALFGIWMMAEQYRMFGKEPQTVSVDQVVPPPPHFDVGTWVHLQGALLYRCGEIVQWRRDPPESWIFGRVQDTYIPATNLYRDRFFLITFDKGVNCQTMRKGPLIGVLTPVNSRLRSTLTGAGLDFPNTKVPAMLLEVDWGPSTTRNYLIGIVILMCACVWMMQRYWRKYQKMKKLEEYAPVAGTTIG